MRLKISDLQPGTNYAVQVRAVNTEVASEWSNKFNFVTFERLTPPAAPTSATWTVVDDSFVATWSPVTQDIEGNQSSVVSYEVELTANSQTKIVTVPPRTDGTNSYTLTYSDNVALFGTARPQVSARIRAVNSKNVKGNWTNTITVSNPVPNPPAGLSASALTNAVALKWTESPDTDIAKYEVYSSTTSGFTPAPANLVFAGPTTSTIHRTTASGTNYYKVRAVDKFGQGSTYLDANAVPEQPFTIDSTPPATPTGGSVTTAYDASRIESSITVSWTASADSDLQNYVVRYGPASGGPWTYIDVPRDTTTASAVVTPGKANYVNIRAVDYAGNISTWGAVANSPITSAVDTVAPGQVTGLSTTASGTSFTSTWNAISVNDLKEYEVGVANGGTEVFYKQTGTRFDFPLELNTSAFTTPKATIAVRVRAIDVGGLAGAWSTVSNATIAAPSAPSGLSNTTGANSITIRWTASTSTTVTGYNVYQGTSANPTTLVAKITGTSFTTTVPATAQYFTVKAVDAFGQESAALNSAAITATNPFIVDTVAPAVPTSLAATITNNANGIGARASLTWTNGGESDRSGIEVSYKRNSDSTWTSSVFGKDQTSAIIDLPTAYVAYDFRIRAFDSSANYSAWSTTLAKAAVAAGTPSTPTGLTASPGKDSIAYSWTPVADTDVKDYELTISTSSTFASGNIVFKNGNSSSLTVSGLNPTTTYYARVRVNNQGGVWGSYSATNTSATTAFPSTPLSDGYAPASSPTPVVSSGIGYLYATWTPVATNSNGGSQVDPVTYEVHLSTTSGFTPSGATKVTEVTGTFAMIDSLPGSSTGLTYGTTYYVRLIAKDRDGSAAVGTQASGIPAKALSGDISGLTTSDVAGAATTTQVNQKSTTFVQSTAPTAVAVNDIWIDTANNNIIKRWTGSVWETRQDNTKTSYEYIMSRGTDLVTNGTGYLKDNTNFSSFTYDPTDAPTGIQGSFTSNVTITAFSDEFIPIDPSKKYVQSIYARQQVPGVESKAYFGLAPYDAAGNVIIPQNYIYQDRTMTTLSVALNPGDTTVTLASVPSGDEWTRLPAYKYLGIWNWQDSFGKVWPAATYTRNIPQWTSISGNVITLSAPYAGPAMPAGTPISRNYPGGNYMYTTMVNITVPETWTKYTSTVITGLFDGKSEATNGAVNSFPAGTAKVKLLFMPNYQGINGGVQAYAGISFSDATAAQKTVDDLTPKVNSSVKTYSVQYAVNSSESTAPTTGWSTSTPARTPGTFIWTRTVVTYQDNSTATTNAALLTGNTGATGSTGAPAPVVTLTSTSQVLVSPAAGGATTPATTTITGTSANTTITAYTYSVNSGAFDTTVPAGVSRSGNVVTITGSTMTAKTITVKMADANGIADTMTVAKVSDGATGAQGPKGDTGDTGATGVGVSGTSVTYQVGTSGTTEPTGTWLSSVPATTAGQYLWTKTVTTYTSGSPTTAFSVSAHGATGATGSTGSAGRGISSTEVTYQVGSSGTTAPTGTWLTSVPATTTGQFLWTKTYTTYTSAPLNDTAYSVAAHGSTGAAGADGYTIVLTNESQTIPAGTSAALGGTFTTGAIAYKGSVQKTISINQANITGLPSGMTAAVSGSGTNSPVVTFTVTTSLTSPSGQVTIPCVVDGITFNQVFSYGLSYTGATGAAGSNAEVISLTSTTQVLSSPAGGGATTPATAVISGAATNTTIGHYEYKVDGGTFGTSLPTGVTRSGNDVTVTGSTFTGKTLTVKMSKASGSPISDTLTVAKVSDGATGAQGPTGNTGSTGPAGADAYTVILTNEAQTFAGSTTAALNGSATTSVIAYKGATQTTATIGTITGQVTGLTTAITNNGTNNATVTITVATTLTQQSGVLTIPVTVDSKTFTKSFAWSVSRTGATGAQGIQGPAGADGTERYTWLKYADTPTSGMSDTPAGKTYMGIAYNKTTATESSNYGDYEWSLIKGADGATGAAGKGISNTVVNYAKDTQGTNGNTVTGWGTTIPTTTTGEFLWTRTVITYTDTSTATAYSVSAHGAQGPQGNTGSTGAAGRGVSGTTVNYAKNTDGANAPASGWGTAIPVTSPGEFLWTRTITTYTDGLNPTTAYSVSAHGATGQQGIQGPAGADGQPTYTWVKYAPNGSPSSAQMSDDPAGMTHIGLAYNKSTQTESTTPGDYQWALIKGDTGPQGPQGNTGAAGTSATSVDLSNEAVAIPTSATGAALAAGTITIPFSGWIGSTRAAATLTYSTLPAGITLGSNTAATTSAAGSLVLNYANGATIGAAASGEITLTITCNSQTFTRTFTWTRAYTGAAGSAGVSATSLDKTPDVFMVPTDSTGKALATGSTQVKFTGMVGATASAVTIGAAPTLPAGITATPSGSPGTNALITFNWTANATIGAADSGTFVWPVVVNSITFNVTIGWARAIKGAQGAQGPAGNDGATGSQGTSVSAITRYWLRQTAGAGTPTTPGNVSSPGGSWTTTEPTYLAGTELWMMDRVSYSNSTYSYTTPAKSSAYEAASTAITAAGGKTRLKFGGSAPTSTTAGIPGDIFWVRSGNTITEQWLCTVGTDITSGNTWVKQELTNTTIANLDAGKISSGFISSDRIQANSLTIGKVSGLQGDLDSKAGKDYVQSRGMNLVTNGTGLLGNNTNFSTMTFTPSEAPAGSGGSFSVVSASATRINDELIPVDPAKVWRYSFQSKQLMPGVSGRMYGLIASYDIDGNSISPYHYYRPYGSVTTLAQELKPGDTTIVLANASDWYSGSVAHQRTIGFYDYTNSRGFTYPAGTYTRNIIYDGTNGAWAQGGISGNTITLNSPYSGVTRPVGTPVGNLASAGGYIYVGASNVIVPDTNWQAYSGEIGGVEYDDSIEVPAGVYKFRPGTAFVKIGWLLNRDVPTSQHAFANVSLSEVTASNIPELVNTKSLVDGWKATGQTTIDGGKIETDSVTAAQIAANTITASEISATAFTGKTFTVGASGYIQSSDYAANSTGWRIDTNGIEVNNGTISATTLKANTTITSNLGVTGTLTIGTGGAVQSSNYTVGGNGWKIDDTGLEINGGAIKADAVRAGDLGGPAGTNSDINITAGTNLITNGGALKSNTFNGTFTSGTYNNNATAGYYMDATNGLVVATGKIKANALVSDTITSTTITLGSGGKIVGGSWELSNSGLTIPDGAITAAKLDINNSPNIINPLYADFEAGPAAYGASNLLVSGGTATIDSTYKYSGASSLKFVTSGTFNYVFFGSGVGVGQTMRDLEVGATYILSYYAMVPSGSPATSFNVHARTHQAASPGYADQTATHSFTNNGVWTRKSMVFTVPANATSTSGSILFLNYTAGHTIYLDNFQVEKRTSTDNSPTPWKAPSWTTIDGGTIKTGAISSANFNSSTHTGWSINTTGAAEFSNLNVWGDTTVGSGAANYIRSSGWSGTGSTTGWGLMGDGTAYLQQADIKGTITATGGQIGSTTINSTSLTGGIIQTHSGATSGIKLTTGGINAYGGGVPVFIVDGSTGNTTIGGTTTIKGTTYLQDNLEVQGGITFTGASGTAFIKGGTTSTSSISAEGDGFILDKDGMYIGGNSRIKASSIVAQEDKNLVSYQYSTMSGTMTDTPIFPAATTGWTAPTMDPATPHLGQKTLKLQNTTATARTVSFAGTATENNIPLDALGGTTVNYIVSMYVRPTVTNAITIGLYNGDTVINTAPVSSGTLTANQWQRIYAVVPTTTEEEVNIKIGIPAVVGVWNIDGIQVERAGANTTPTDWAPSGGTLIDGSAIRANTITAAHLSTEMASIGSLSIGEVTSDLSIVGEGALTVGNIKLSSAGFTIDHGDGSSSGVAADGTGAVWRGRSELDSLTVIGDMDLRGEGLRVSGPVTLSTGVQRPSIAPTVTSGYERFPGNGASDHRGMGVRYGFPDQWIGTTWYFGSYVQSMIMSGNGGFGWWGFDILPDWHAAGGVTAIGQYYYVLARYLDTSNPSWWRVLVYQDNGNGASYIRAYYTQPVGESSIEPAGTPMIGHDGTNVVVSWEAGGRVYIRRLHPETSASRGQQVGNTLVGPANGWTSNSGVHGVAYWNGYYFISSRGGGAYAYTAGSSTLTRAPSQDFSMAAGNVDGLMHDGTRFWSHHNGSEYAYKYTNNSGTWKFGYTWYDSVSPTAETLISPIATVTPKKYARWTIKVPKSPPGGSDPQEPNTARLYAGTASTYFLQPAGGPDDALPIGTLSKAFDSLTTSSTSAPSTDGFEGREGAIGKIVSYDTTGGIPDTEISGTGTPRISKLVQSGRALITMPNAALGSVAITFPVPFNKSPNVTITPYGGSVFFGSTTGVSSTGFTAQMRHYQATATTANIYVDWVAVAT